MGDRTESGHRAPTASAPREPDAKRPRHDFDVGDETTMNMTPMIDIVFQLIIFFLLSLKFKTVDERIDAKLPKHLGEKTDPVPLIETPKVKVKLFRKNKGQPDAYTLVRVDNSHTLRMPEGRWAGDGETEAARQRQYDAVRAQLRGILEQKWDAVNRDPDMRAEIVAARPDGAVVPHGDAIQVLDTFLEVGLTNVMFEGAPMPRMIGP